MSPVREGKRLRLTWLLDMIRRLDPQFFQFMFVLIRGAGVMEGAGRASDAMVDAMKKQRATGEVPSPPSASPSKQDDEADLQGLANQLIRFGLPFSARYLRRRIDADRDATLLVDYLPQLRFTMEAELETKALIDVPPELTRYLDQEALFGEDVNRRFPDAIDDIQDAGNALALGLWPAAVFHLMRVMEHALRAVATSLALPDPSGTADRNWGTILQNIDKEIAKRDKQQPPDPDWKSQRPVYKAAYGLLDGVRIAWRNETMHVDAKYTADSAERILGAVKGFMGYLVRLP